MEMAMELAARNKCIGLEGSWTCEAYRVRALAGELGIELDERRLLYFDVRELVTLRLRLRAALERCGWRRRRLLRPAVEGVLLR